ncbi:MAG: copper-binding protein, partial [Thalassotalea sp.]
MNMNMNMKNEVSSATVLGVINAIDKKNRTLNISREAIEKWNRPAARFDFLVTDAIDIQALTIGMKVRFTFEVRDDLVIIAISPQNNPANSMNQQQMSVEHAEH